MKQINPMLRIYTEINIIMIFMNTYSQSIINNIIIRTKLLLNNDFFIKYFYIL
jgi:hypothetical protein